MRQRILRLALLVLIMVLTAVGSFASPPPPVDCSQFNRGSCTYTWDQASFCCRPKGGFCVWYCI